MSNRNVDLWESPYDLQKLSTNGFNFCIAKSVIDSSGNLTFNMVWKSLNLAPRASISWTVQYGLNWALNVPTGNAQITLGGVWQPCNAGEVYDIDSVGLFQPSAVSSQPGYLKVGRNGYSYGGSSGIHIIVGVQSPGGGFDPVFIDRTALSPNMSAWYQPQEKAQWWYEKGVQSASMISGAASQVCPYDLTQKNPRTNTYYVSTTFQYDTGIWSTSLAPPPSVNTSGLLRPFGTLNIGLNDSALDKIRRDVSVFSILPFLYLPSFIESPPTDNVFIPSSVDIMEALGKIGHQSQVQAPGSEFFYGIVRFATIAYCTHGVKAIMDQLISKGYQAEFTLDGTKMVANIKITPPSKFQSTGFTGGTVPQQVVNDWNAAVKADAVDNPTNEGISSSGGGGNILTQSSDNDVDKAAENGDDEDASAK